MTNILMIALQKSEEKIACIITAYYEIEIDINIIVKALLDNQYQWMMFVWNFNKNYIGKRNNSDSIRITYDQLFKAILKKHSDDKEKAN